ncbi:hypothetical protein GJ633_04120 [Halorubrum sp. CBA1125]|uniref:hypothetical protein n=1 Tax=Halorubrum sp. CBA1125 TaxID=2668072 RepID=UPI0012E9677B|nr:hypothetical protein [Halorubrum sp. CBA1125]MUW13938.1 hypothetical protein [Halorubrum sp. CBA1125]
MTNYPIRCLVDGCDRGPFDDEASLRGHVNASGAAGHDWSEVKDQLEAEDNDQSEGSDEGGKGGDGSEADDQSEEGDDQGEAGNEGSNDQEETDVEDDMPTQDEYEDQHDGNDDGGKDGDGSGDEDTSDQGNATSGSPLPSLPMDPKTLGMLLAVALVLWLSYRALSGSSEDDQPTARAEAGKAGDDSTTDDQEIQGGLTG